MTQKRNVVLYLDAELVSKTRELGFNISKTFENYLKQLITRFSALYTKNNSENSVIFGSHGEMGA
jgi:post-segregation antitoxin (ccd killing protein)